MQLYTYWRSSAAYRVRIALNLKGLPYEAVPVHLLRDGGQQYAPAYRALNPQALVPALLVDEETVLTQSLAIVEYLEETCPDPPLLPADPVLRAKVRAVALAAAADAHPLNNLRVLTYLRETLGQPEPSVTAWIRHWFGLALPALETMLTPIAGTFACGDAPGLADTCIVPLLYSARRFGCDLEACPTLVRVDAACQELEAFRTAAPPMQPDAG